MLAVPLGRHLPALMPSMPAEAIRRLVATATLIVLADAVSASHASAHGGKVLETDVADLRAALVLAAVLTSVLGAWWVAYRRGRARYVRRLVDRASRATGLPDWLALPVGLTLVSLAMALFGFYWDVAFHIDEGRDPNVLANPAHWPVLVGLVGTFLGGLIAAAVGCDAGVSSAVKLRDGHFIPAAAVAMCVCGAVSAAGFVLDAGWHVVAGQDVELWGPMHLVDVTAASLAAIAMWLLLLEARLSDPQIGAKRSYRTLLAVMSAAVLIATSDIQAEYDFGAPLYSILYQPLLITVAGAFSLVLARLAVGTGGAIAALLIFVSLRALVAGFVGGVTGQSAPRFVTYLGAALVVEVTAVWIHKPALLAIVVGSGVGTVGLLAERVWINAVLPLEWPAAALPITMVVGVVGGIAGATIAVCIATHVLPLGTGPMRNSRLAVLFAGMILMVSVAVLAPREAPRGIQATVRLKPLGDGRAHADVIITRGTVPPNAWWFTIVAFRGGGLRVVRLDNVGQGRFASAQPFPIGGRWQVVVRYHEGRSLLALPISMPADPKTGAPPSEFAGEFVRDRDVVLRDSREVPALARTTAFALATTLIGFAVAALAWAVQRIARAASYSSDVAYGERPRVADSRPPSAQNQFRG